MGSSTPSPFPLSYPFPPRLIRSLTSPKSIPWGVFATIGPAYASEVLPLALRPYLTAYVNMCFAIGQFIGAGVIQAELNRPDEWSYRIPYGVQWVWPLPLFLVCFLMPESPWWLVRQGRLDEAENVLRRLTHGAESDKAPATLAMMVHTNSIELEIEEGVSYLDCFKGPNLRRTEIACMVFTGQGASRARVLVCSRLTMIWLLHSACWQSVCLFRHLFLRARLVEPSHEMLPVKEIRTML